MHSVSATELMRHLGYQALGPVYEPLYEDHMNAERTATQYGTSVDKLMSSGPFKMVEWTPGRERVFEKNPHYVHADMVRLDGVVLHVVENPSTQLQMFENGELDQCAIPPTDFERYIDDPRYLPVASRYVRILEVNGKHRKNTGQHQPKKGTLLCNRSCDSCRTREGNSLSNACAEYQHCGFY